MKNILSKTLAEKRTQNGVKSYSFPTRLLYTISIFAFLTLGVGQMWATYYYRGGDNSWGATEMTISTDGLYEYKSSSNNANQFKISTSASSYDYNYTYVDAGFNSTNVTSIGDYGKDNCYCWQSGTYYILVYYPNTAINTTNKPKICASTTLPSNTFTVTYNANGGSGTTAANTGVKYNASTTLKANGFTAPSGYHFVGWNTAADYSGTTYAAGASFTVTGNVTLYAKWAKTIYVYDATSWGSLNLYTYSSPRNGSWPGNTTGVTSLGSSWYQVDILSGAASFILNCSSSGDNNKTADQTTSNFTDGRSYYINNSTSPRGLTEKTLTVSFNMKSHGDQVSSQNVYYKGLVTEPDDPSATGYSFGGWYKESACTNKWNFSSDKVTAATTLYAKWTENKSTITLVASPSGKGTFQVGGVTVTSTQAGVTTTPEVTAVPIPGYSFSGWSITGGATISSTTDNPTTVTGAGAGAAATLTATFEEDLTYYDVTFGVGTSYTSLGSISATNNTTSSAISSGDDILSASNITFTATPNTGYVVEGWYTDAACTAGKHDAGSTTYTIASLSSDVTVYVKFVEKTWSVAFAAGTGGTVTTPAATPQTVGQVTGISIAATPATGYTFNRWTITSGSGSFTSAATTNSNTFKPTAASTITASFNETMSSLSTSCHYDAGNPSYAAPTVSNSATTIGYGTTRTITATAAGTGYTFAGWTLTNCTRTDGGAATATSITIRSNGDGAAATVVANYNEVLTSRWHLVGANVASKVTYPDGWNVSNISMMQKATGHSTESVVYANVTVSNADGTYEFKVVDDNGASDDIWYGYSTGGTYLTWTGTSTKNVYSGDGNSNNLKFTPTVAGTYVFKVDYSGTYPAVTITYPVSYTLTYGIGTVKGNNGSISTSPTTASGSKVISDTEITLTGPAAKTGYTWKGWYTNAAGTEGKITDTNRAITVTMNADKTLYACYTINNHAITHSDASHGSYTIKVGDASAVSTNTTSDYGKTITLAATPATGYHFGSWSAYKTGTPATTVTVTSNQFTMPDYAVTVGATFTPNTYRVQFHRNGASEATVYQNFTYDVAQNLTTNTYTRTGYTFGGWATSKERADAGTVDYTDGENVNNLTSTNEGIYHLYAKWTPNPYTIVLDKQTSAEGYGGNAGTVANQTVTFDATPATVSGTMPSAANGYAFMGFYSATGGNGRRFIDPSGNWETSAGDTISGGKWVKPAGITLYAYYKKAEITALTFDNAVVAPGGSVGVTPTVAPTPAGTNSICWKLLYSNGNLYDPQPTFSPASPAGISNKVTFNAPTTSGTYRIAAVLRTGNDCNGGTELSTRTASFQVAGDHTVTIQYKCGSEVIAPSTTTTGRPLTWSDEITPAEIFGYTFEKWVAGDGVTMTINGGVTTIATGGETTGKATTHAVQIKATYDGKLTAKYTQNNIIYFKNTLGWSSVYVNLLSGSYWDSKGSGNENQTNRNKTMTQIGETDVWYYDYGNISPSLYVSFTSSPQTNSKNFWSSGDGVNVVYPTRSIIDGTTVEAEKPNDNGFYSKTPMFVPLADQKAKVMNNEGGGKANYFNNGYWTKYTSGTGYQLKVYDSETGGNLLKTIEFSSTDELMPMAATTDLEANKTYYYEIMREGDVYYGNDNDMSYSDHGQSTAWEVTWKSGGHRAGLTTTASGDYVFHLTYSAASNQYRLRIAVDYPIANNDYRVVYSDGVQTKALVSKIVTNNPSGKDTVSFFIRPKNASKLLKIQKATVNSSTGAITWNDYGEAITSQITDAKCPKDSVYNICLQMDGSGAISVENVEAYMGEYYIRTDAANNKWDNYRAADHLMTYSEYSERNSDYTHYFVKYVNQGTNVKFVVANDYSPNISDTLIVQTHRGGDSDHVTGTGFLKTPLDGGGVNVRFMWDRSNNAIYRAYLAPAQSDGSKFLVLRSNSSNDLRDEADVALTTAGGNNHGAPDNCMQFVDNENWIYETTVMVKPSAYVKLYGHFHGTDFYFKGNNNNLFNNDKIDGIPNAIQLITGSSASRVKVRVVYDFKTDRLVAAYLPSGNIEDPMAVNADVMFVREHQGDIDQLTFTDDGKITNINTAYGVMRFNKYTINNKEKTGSHSPLASPASYYERALYWVSFPFRVKLSEVFGFGTYGTHWILQYYDGEERAKKGLWQETGSYWKFVWDRKDFVLEPNTGYLLTLEPDLMGEDATDVWGPESRSSQVELYFPSYGTMPDITKNNVVHTLAPYTCTINRSGGNLPGGNDYRTTYDRRIVDSHWHVMGVPTYVNTDDITFAQTSWTDSIGPNFLYIWNADDNTITAASARGFEYHAMHAYMVQYHGTVTWAAQSGSQYSPIVARRTYSGKPKEVEFCIEIQQNEKMMDRTFIKLSNDETVSAGFAFNEDMTKEFSGNKPSIYTFIDGDVVAAGNTMPMSEQTTIVPLGIETKQAGDYTIAIPEGTDGIGVTLIDEETGVRTSLSALDYTINLPAGKHDNRFFLEISPIKNTPTDIENEEIVNRKSSNRKLLIDGILYIVKDGKMYDARGTRVE